MIWEVLNYKYMYICYIYINMISLIHNHENINSLSKYKDIHVSYLISFYMHAFKDKNVWFK